MTTGFLLSAVLTVSAVLRPICANAPFVVGDILPQKNLASNFLVKSVAVIKAPQFKDKAGAWVLRDDRGNRWMVGTYFMPKDLWNRIGKPSMPVIDGKALGGRTSQLIHLQRNFLLRDVVECGASPERAQSNSQASSEPVPVISARSVMRRRAPGLRPR